MLLTPPQEAALLKAMTREALTLDDTLTLGAVHAELLLRQAMRRRYPAMDHYAPARDHPEA